MYSTNLFIYQHFISRFGNNQQFTPLRRRRRDGGGGVTKGRYLEGINLCQKIYANQMDPSLLLFPSDQRDKIKKRGVGERGREGEGGKKIMLS